MDVATSSRKLTGDGQAIKEFIDKFDTFLFDCDGVLWSGDILLDRAAEAIGMLRGKGKRLVFVTNNSTKSRADYKKKFDNFDIDANVDEIFGSSYSAAIYISRKLKLPKNEKVFVIGESGIESELRSEGIFCIGGADPNLRRDIEPSDYAKIASGDALDPAVTVVLAGLDFHINYLKLSLAFHYLCRPGVRFLLTNIDATLPNSHALFPGASSIAASLVNMMRSLNRDVEPLAMGKPSQAMMDVVVDILTLDRSRTCMVGDRLNTDIKFGIEGKLGGTLGVLTGVMREDDLKQAGKEGRDEGPSAGGSLLTHQVEGHVRSVNNNFINIIHPETTISPQKTLPVTSMPDFKTTATIASFGGKLLKLTHYAAATGCEMALNLYLPPEVPGSKKAPALFYLSGLTCTGDNCAEKGFFQQGASQKGIAVVYPDTSPRGLNIVGEEDAYDFGTGAGFYVDATQAPWSKSYKMESYIAELHTTLFASFPQLDPENFGITGHSMGGHGALTLFLRNPGKYRSVSAFAPISNPSNCPWGQKAFQGYFGDENKDEWKKHDATELVKLYKGPLDLLIDVGTGDNFYKQGQLLPENFAAAAAEAGNDKELNIRYQPRTNLTQTQGYDHSYYFVSTFAADHLAHHAKYLLP
ncbi:MAG: hypothetical protein M1840_001581 [Geoglossum simile]|nr:MAG: hypothetical protein M1840_001581 [Geoglossum simile]